MFLNKKQLNKYHVYALFELFIKSKGRIKYSVAGQYHNVFTVFLVNIFCLIGYCSEYSTQFIWWDQRLILLHNICQCNKGNSLHKFRLVLNQTHLTSSSDNPLLCYKIKMCNKQTAGTGCIQFSLLSLLFLADSLLHSR